MCAQLGGIPHAQQPGGQAGVGEVELGGLHQAFVEVAEERRQQHDQKARLEHGQPGAPGAEGGEALEGAMY